MGRERGGDGLVWSTEHGRMCPGCSQPIADCRCATGGSGAAADGWVRVGRETQGRKGAGVSVVSGLGLPAAELKDLAKQLKRRCGSGGTLRDGRIEIQGEHRDLLVAELERRGYKVKRAGG